MFCSRREKSVCHRTASFEETDSYSGDSGIDLDRELLDVSGNHCRYTKRASTTCTRKSFWPCGASEPLLPSLLLHAD